MYDKKIKLRIVNDSDSIEYINDLVKNDLIEDEIALGVAKALVGRGPEGLTENQWYRLIEKGLLPNNYVDECELCLSTIPWSEMYNAIHYNENNLCGYCHHKLEKLEKE